MPPLVALPTPEDSRRLREFDGAIAAADRASARGWESANPGRELVAAELVKALKEKAAKLRKEKAEHEKRVPTVMVMEDLQTPRPPTC